MAHEKNDISDIVKKCKILLLDIEGTTTSISFVKDKLFPYAEENVKDFLSNEWDSDDVKDVVTALRKLALEDEEKKVEGVVTIPGEDASKDDQIDGLVKSVKWQMSLDRKVGPLKQLQGLIWKKGYDKGDIKGHVYDDVSPALELWQSVEGQKVYIYSSGSVQAQKLLFGLSSAGDLLKFIEGHFDTAVGAKQESASYTAIAEKIGCKPEEILFLTDIDKEAEAARSAGVQAALVSREGNAPLAEAVAASFPVLYSLAELAATNKRKPDAQEEQPATKVLKTDVEADVKSSTEAEVKEAPAEPQKSEETKSEELEKMEVEEVAPTKEEIAEEKPKETAEKVITIVEEVTESNEIADMPVCDVEPIIEESTEKTEIKETEKMETDIEETVNSVSEPKQNAELKNGDKDSPVPEETPPAVVTEIKDITNDKESLSEVAEIIEDIVPVVEEPPSQDMEELQNVGEVLDKECDEILSKVQDVTNLDNIPLKPLLNPIAEETMETENVDSNDIVERILDSELELEMKQQQCADIDPNTVQEISDVTDATEEVKSEKKEVAKTETAAVTEEKPMETEEIKVINEKIEESTHAEEKGNSIAEEKANSIAEEKTNSTAEEKANSTAEEKANSTAEERAKSTAEEKANSTAEEKANSTAEEKANSTAEEKANSTAEEKANSTAEEKANSTAEEKANSTAEVKAKSTAEEKVNSSVEQKANSTVEEKANSTVEEKGNSSVEEKANSTAEEKVDKNMDEKDNSTVEEKTKVDEKSISNVEDKPNGNTEEKQNNVEEKQNNVEVKQNSNDEEKPNCTTEQKVEESSPTEPKVEEKMEVNNDETKLEQGTVENKMETETSTPESDDSKPKLEVDKTEENIVTEAKTDAEEKIAVETADTAVKEAPVETLTEESPMETEQPEIPVETKENNKIDTTSAPTQEPKEDSKEESDTMETQVNGKTTNGDAQDVEMVNLNGDASKEDKLSARLAIENGKEVNGANGDSNEAEETKSENNGEEIKEVADIKVKTVAKEEQRNDPIEQPTEA